MNVLITGANRGIGLELTKKMLIGGHYVYATVRNRHEKGPLQDLLVAYPEHISLHTVDAVVPEDWCRLSGMLADVCLDRLVINAGVALRHGPLGEINYTMMKDCFEVNTLGPLRCLEACIPALKRGVEKKVFTITSKMGSLADNSSGGAYAYRTSKTAVNSIMRSAAIDLREHGIGVYLLHPGWVLTKMGGPNALITVEQSVDGMCNVMNKLDLQQTGSFWEWSGGRVPW